MRKSIIFTLAFLVALLLTLVIRAQSPQDYVVMQAWEHVRRADAYQYPSGLISYYSMDSRSGDDSTVFDTFGSNDGTAINEPAFGSAYGKYLEGVGQDGSVMYIRCPDSPLLGNLSTDFAISVWMNAASTDRLYAFGYGHSQSDTPLVGITTINNEIQFPVRDGNNILVQASGYGITNAWNHAVLTWDATGKAVEGYINGSSIGTASNASLGTAGFNRVIIGAIVRTQSQFYFNGSLDEVAIWNRALSSNEVSEIYNNGEGIFYTP